MGNGEAEYAFGILKTATLEVFTPENPAEIHIPLLKIYSTVTTWIRCETIGISGEQIQPYNSSCSFIVPLHDLGTLKQCEEWVKVTLRSLRLMVVASETGNVRELLVDLIWKLRERMEAGEMCVGVVEMDVLKVVERLMDFRKRVVETWMKERMNKFEGENGNLCPICLDELDENTDVVTLPCRHDFHSGCIGDWLIQKTHCPCCRSRVQVRYRFGMHKKIWSIAHIQFPLSAFVIPC